MTPSTEIAYVVISGGEPSSGVDVRPTQKTRKTTQDEGPPENARTRKLCQEEDCTKLSSFNMEGQTRGLYCATHKLPGMVNVKSKRCEFDGCMTQPTFNVDGQTRGLYCATHKLPGMVVVVGKRCLEEGCRADPSFNLEGEKLGIYCKKHKKGGMKDVKHKRCEFERCIKRASFNVEGQTRVIYCADHKIPGMIILNSKRCDFGGCVKNPSFNVQGHTPGIFCSVHKIPGMVDVRNKPCQFDGCLKSASFNVNGQCRGVYCADHKLLGMVDVRSKRCKFEGCTKNPSFNVNGQTTCTYCADHKIPGMLDVKSKRCEGVCCSPFPIALRSIAKLSHPETGIRLCPHACHNMIIKARIEDDDDEAERLKKYFGFKQSLLLRAEHVFYFELVKKVPRLTTLTRVLDQTVFAKLFDKTKDLKDPRPDYFHLNTTTNMALHGEFDETNDHEDDHDRLRKIAHHAGCGAHRVYYFRVNACIGTAKALLRRVKRKQGRYYSMTPLGRSVLDQVAAYVEECLDLMKANQPPPAAEGDDLAIRRF